MFAPEDAALERELAFFARVFDLNVAEVKRDAPPNPTDAPPKHSRTVVKPKRKKARADAARERAKAARARPSV